MSSKDTLFVFGDNDVGFGKKGQAIIRDCPNAMGIPTKKRPILKKEAFYTDTEFHENCVKIDKAITRITNTFLGSEAYKVLMFPGAGLGVGLAQLDTRAPRTYAYLLTQIRALEARVGEAVSEKEKK